MGEMILCLDTITSDPRVIVDETEPILRMVERFVTDGLASVTTDDTGLWEYRTFPSKYTFSHVLCWVAASRGAKVARRFGHHTIAREWEAWAEGYRQELLNRAYNAELGCFTTSAFSIRSFWWAEGNFPQAYTHVGSINTAVTISELLEARDARFHAWS